MSEPTPSPRWYQWPTVWFRDQAFWRDVATQALSVGVVAFVVFVTGVLLGYFRNPGVISFLAAFVGQGALYAGMGGAFVAAVKLMPKVKNPAVKLLLVVGTIGVVVGLPLLYFVLARAAYS